MDNNNQRKKEYRISNKPRTVIKKEEPKQLQKPQPVVSSEFDQLKKENSFLRSELIAAQEQIGQLMNEVKRLQHRQQIPEEVMMAMQMQRQMQQQQYYEFMQEACRPQPQFQTDNMTYEQLLELEEKIGHVSRGLTKEQIHKIPKRTVYAKQKEPCSICQSDIIKFEKIRELRCTHTYHSKCIKQWLVNEKKCPICKEEQ